MSDKPNSIVQKMYQHDAFSKWLGIEIIDVKKGFCKCSLKIREEMTNGLGIAHGGITYSLADSTLAFASNSEGRKAVSIETSVSHLESLTAGDIITATSESVGGNHKIGIYIIKITDQHMKTVASFKGTVYKKSETWEI